MQYHALIALDLTGVPEEKTAVFYNTLANEKWAKVSNLSTSWKVSFLVGVTRQGAISTLESDLHKAKEAGKIARINYAIQLDTQDLLISNL
ncbi:MAG TPA: hypothetical protein VK623_05715 [Flavobacterium sp.]|nr:hypothetical protein [Flavobacterium sp.]